MPLSTYRRRCRHLVAVGALLAVLMAIILLGMMAGTHAFSLSEVLAALRGEGNRLAGIMVWELRLPRSLIALVAGIGLALSGFLLQRLFQNPLAGPSMMGVTAGSVAPIIACASMLPALDVRWYPLLGSVGGAGAAGLSWWLGRGGRYGPLQLILAGACVALFINALNTWMVLRRGADSPTLLFWLAGGLQGRSWPQLYFILPWVMVVALLVIASQRVLALLALDEAVATSIGVDLRKWKPFLLLLAVLPVAAITSIAGPIAFVGLVAPHIAHFLRPTGMLLRITTTALVGGALLMAADVLARIIAVPREIPIGIMTSLLGAPLLLWLVQARVLKRGSMR